MQSTVRKNGGKDGALQKRIDKAISSVYDKIIPKMKNELMQLASDNDESESNGSGSYSRLLNNLLVNATAMEEHYKRRPVKQKKETGKSIEGLPKLTIPK